MANTLELYRNGAVGFIVWLDEFLLKVHLSNDRMLSRIIINCERLPASSDECRSFLFWKVDDPVDDMRALSPFVFNSVDARLPVLRSADILLDHARVFNGGE